MFWRYMLFEGKLALNNRKNWIIALFFLVIFTLLFMYTSQENEPESLYDQKVAEAEDIKSAFYYMDDVRFDDDDAAEVYDIITEESSLINFQKWYIGSGGEPDEFIENGLELNKLRLKAYELGNAGLPSHLVIPKKEILQEDALMKYIKANDLPLESESFITSFYIEEGFKAMSGLLFFIVVLIAGSEMLTFEQRHESIYNGFPIPFIQRVATKVFIQFVYIYLFFIAGFFIGLEYLKRKLELFDYHFPILIYVNGDYEAISVLRYTLYMLIAFSLVTIITLLIAILFNMVLKHTFATILAGLGIFMIPYLIILAGWKVPILSSIIYLDFANVMAGDASENLRYTSIDFVNGYIWMTVVIFLLSAVIYVLRKSSYFGRKNQKIKYAA